MNAVHLAVFQNAVHSVAEEMGAALRRTSSSPNIKERRDYSCAVFDAAANAIGMGDHMPVHLGSMPMSVQAAVHAVRFEPGDIAVLNDPYAGGTHLPDITMVAPVFVKEEPAFFVAARAHHADVGGRYPGSMGLCTDIFQEGIRIPPVKLTPEIFGMIVSNVRTPDERRGDLLAQIGACRVGQTRLGHVIQRYGLARAIQLSRDLLDYSEQLTRRLLGDMPGGRFEAQDFLDDDGAGSGPINIDVAVSFHPDSRSAEVDFTGSHAQVGTSLNAVAAITHSAVYYVFRCLLPPHAPATSGIMRPIRVLTPLGSIVDAQWPAPVAGGNVETSQRIVDVVLKALAQAIPDRIPAASSGTMNNLTVGGIDPRTGKPFAYYETIAGGMGATPSDDGLSGVHTHMTNSLNTPAEALEYAYPLRITRYSYRRDSGGAGRFRGGDGLIREIELLADASVTVLADRRMTRPYGVAGGDPGSPGETAHNGVALPGKCSIQAKAGDRIQIRTPGGGGFGNLSVCNTT